MSKNGETAAWVRWVIPILMAAAGGIGTFALKEALAAKAEVSVARLEVVQLNAETRELMAALAKEMMEAARDEARYEVNQYREREGKPQAAQVELLREEVVNLRGATMRMQAEVAAGRRERHRARGGP